jgi:predicted acetyltransferase
MNIEIYSRGEMPGAERKQVDAWLMQVFADDTRNFVWSDDDWYVLVKLDSQVICHVGIVERTGTVNGQPVKLGGIGGVATLPEYRRQGYARFAMETASTFMRGGLGVEFGLLICDHKMVPYYGKLGWQVAQGPMQFDQPKGKVTFTEPVMILPCNKHDWPPGVIDLCGPPW